MKNIILGLIASMLTIYLVVISISIYSVYVRKNEMDKCLSQTLFSSMDRHYISRIMMPQNMASEESEVEEELINDIEDRLTSDSEVQVNIRICDMEQGIISAEIRESFVLPFGIKKEIITSKTIIADREEE